MSTISSLLQKSPNSSSNTWTLPADRDASALNNLDKYSLTSSLGDDKRLSIPFYENKQTNKASPKYWSLKNFPRGGFSSSTIYELVAQCICTCVLQEWFKMTLKQIGILLSVVHVEIETRCGTRGLGLNKKKHFSLNSAVFK